MTWMGTKGSNQSVLLYGAAATAAAGLGLAWLTWRTQRELKTLREDHAEVVASVAKRKAAAAAADAALQRDVADLRRQVATLQEDARDAAREATQRWPGRVMRGSSTNSLDAASDAGSDAAVSVAGSLNAEDTAELKKVRAMVGAASVAFSQQLRRVRQEVRDLRDEFKAAKRPDPALLPAPSDLQEASPDEELSQLKNMRVSRPFAPGPAHRRLRAACHALLGAWAEATSAEAASDIIQRLFSSAPAEVEIEAPLFCTFGINVHVGQGFRAGSGLVLEDYAPIRFGAGCRLGPGVHIYTMDQHRTPKEGLVAYPVTIGENVRIGGRALIVAVAPIRIGDGAVIAPGAIVTSDVPARAVVQAAVAGRR